MIKITESAIEKLKTLISEENMDVNTHYLRVGVKGGGCSGLSYIMDFDTHTDEDDTVIKIDPINVIINKKSLLYISGTTLDHQGGLNGKGFDWINPNASRTCGCGESFSL